MPLAQLCEEVLPASRQWTALAAAPVTTLGEIRRLDLSGARRLLEEDEYAGTIAADGTARLRLLRSVTEERLVVRYTAGLASDWDRLDAGIRQGIVRLAAHYYHERGTDAGLSPPASVAALWRPLRRMRLR